jgi:hypothetical protein
MFMSLLVSARLEGAMRRLRVFSGTETTFEVTTSHLILQVSNRKLLPRCQLVLASRDRTLSLTDSTLANQLVGISPS